MAMQFDYINLIMAIYSNTDLVVICLRSYILPGLTLIRFGVFGLGAYILMLLAYY